MKDRIKRIMEEQHMNQQVFANLIGMSPATLCSIFTGRTKPTIKVVGAIKNKFPSINTDWLLMGTGNMYVDDKAIVSATGDTTPQSSYEPVLNFDQPVLEQPTPSFPQGVRNTSSENVPQIMKIIDKAPRKVTEIRVYYDDQTYETFVPMKSK